MPVLLAVFLLAATNCRHEGMETVYRPPELVGTTWELIRDPEAYGWSLEKLTRAYEYSRTIDTAALMLIHDGKVLYYWGDISAKYWTHSARKSFMSALFGIWVDRGDIRLDETLAQLGIDDNEPSLSDEEKQATVRMLLQARSGVYHEAAAESASMKAARPARHSHPPGTFWYYNNWDFNALLTIFEQQTRRRFFEELKAAIFDPIGTEDFLLTDGFYSYEEVSIHPAYPFRITARDMARFGLLFLNRGLWQGRRVVPEWWVEESTTSYSDAGGAGGYGYMWWAAVDGRHFPYVTLPDGSYSAQGAYGQYCLVIPAYDLVVVHRVNSDVGDEVTWEQFGRLLQYILRARER